MKLVIMTKSTFLVEEDKVLTALSDEGMGNLHLHKPGLSPPYSERLLSLLPEKYHKRITVHEHYYLRNKYNLSGTHLDQLTDQPSAGHRGRITRNRSDLSLLKETKKKADGILSAYIFDSIREGNHKVNFNVQQIEETAKRGLIDRHVFAAGGMNIDNIELVKNYDFGGVVIRGDLWSRFDTHNETDFKDLVAHPKKLRKVVGQEHGSLQLKDTLQHYKS